MKAVRRFFILLCVARFFLPAAAQGYSNQQLIPAGHWVYDALNAICLEGKFLSIADNAPLSVLELKFYLSTIDYGSLSSGGKQLYDTVREFLDERKPAVDLKPVRAGVNLELNPSMVTRTNRDVEWSMATDYTGKQTASDYSLAAADGSPGLSREALMQNGYAAESSFTPSEFTRPLIVVPVVIDVDGTFVIEADFSFGMSQFGFLHDDYLAHSLCYSMSRSDGYVPKVAYASLGHVFGSGWGFNAHVARSGLQIGSTSTGSIIYNSTFNTDVYFHAEVFSRQFKYEVNVAEVNHSDNEPKFLYLHSLEVIPWRWLKVGILEGTLINGGFSLRYLNPLMIFHSFTTWSQMSTDWERDVYGEAHTCAYMGVSLEILPCRSTRIYILYAQDEIQPPTEQGSAAGRSVPDGWGWQAGVEVKIPEEHGGWYAAGLEGIYTTPYLYIKQAKEWSLYSYRYNVQSDGSVPLCSWIGTPFGPDAIGFQTKFGYTKPRKWSAEGNYLFLAHGTNSFGIFSEYSADADGKTYNSYYPAVKYNTGALSASDAEKLARRFGLTGTVQFTNQVAVKGSYAFNDHVTADGQLMYQFVFNNANVPGNFQHGLELALGLHCSLF